MATFLDEDFLKLTQALAESEAHAEDLAKKSASFAAEVNSLTEENQWLRTALRAMQEAMDQKQARLDRIARVAEGGTREELVCAIREW
jgi:septal ring factor EnvC (AmiA/AmiB activator)